MNYDLNTLNEEQLKPLKQTEGAILVTAGAGSGKTRLLTYRVAYLIEEKRVSPYNILAITFTNKAAGEMRDRISQMVYGADRVWISTFHSMCAKLLRMEIDVLYPFTKEFSIYSESDSDKVIKEVLSEQGISDDKFKKAVVHHLSDWKNGNQSLSDYLQTHSSEFDMNKIGHSIMAYQRRLQKNNALDFDDLLLKTLELFDKFPEIQEKYANRFEYILVDEFQDTNTVQYELVKRLASVHGNIFVVGDEDQCIYSWRGANFQNIFNFKKDFPNVQVYKLERNYRSTNEIIQIANNVIKNNSTRLNKNMWTDKMGGDKPSLYNAYDEREEALYVAKTIYKLEKEGYEYKDFAVLMRMNALSRSFEEAFLSYDIPHRIFGGFKFYERQEIKNILSYLRLFTNPKDDISFLRIINFPRRGIGDGTIAKLNDINPQKSLLENCLSENLKENAVLFKKFQSFIEIFNQLSIFSQKPLSNFVEKVISSFKIREAYNPNEEEDLDRLMNIEQLVSSVKEFEALNEDATLNDFLESVTLKSDNDEIGQGGAVTIATVHAVKGLEFKVVFIVGLEEGIFPISRALNNNYELEEERRLMYVALTRAEEKLFLSYASKRYLYRESQYQTPSRFCREIGLLSLERTENKSYMSDRSYEGNNYSRNYDNKNYDKSYLTSYGQKNKYTFDNDLSYNNFEHSDVDNNKNLQPLFNKSNFFKQKEDPKEKKDVSVYKVGQRVFYKRFGEGQIINISSDGLVADIMFDDYGKKSLMLETAQIDILG